MIFCFNNEYSRNLELFYLFGFMTQLDSTNRVTVKCDPNDLENNKKMKKHLKKFSKK